MVRIPNATRGGDVWPSAQHNQAIAQEARVMRLTLAGEVSTRRFRQYAGPVVLALILFEAVSLAVTA